MESLTSLPTWAYIILAIAIIAVFYSLFQKLFKIALGLGVIIIIFLIIVKLANSVPIP